MLTKLFKKHSRSSKKQQKKPTKAKERKERNERNERNERKERKEKVKGRNKLNTSIAPETFDTTRKVWNRKELINLSAKNIPQLREILTKQNNYKCPVCGRSLKTNPCVLDHKHKRKIDKIGGKNQLGLCRGVLCRYCNTVEGKLLKDLARFGKINDPSLKETKNWLINLAKYYEQPLLRYVHPTEKEK